MNREIVMLYLFTFFIMHYCAFVLIDAVDDVESAVDSRLQSFDEGLEVEPYRVHLSHQGVRRMAEHYKIHPADLQALVEKMPEWTNRSGGVDRDGLYYLTTCNPDGRWDWYEIGGRWNRYIPGARNNVINAGTLAKSPNLPRCLPYFVLTPGGNWLERERFYFADDWKATKKEALDDEEWLRIVRDVLHRWPDCRVVCVDIHC